MIIYLMDRKKGETFKNPNFNKFMRTFIVNELIFIIHFIDKIVYDSKNDF